MPGGISGLVNRMQGVEKPAVSAPAEPEPAEEVVAEPEPVREPVHHEPALHTKPAAPADEKDRSAPAAKKLPKAEGKELAREYTLQQGDTTDSWQMFHGVHRLRPEECARQAEVCQQHQDAVYGAAQFHCCPFRFRPRKEHKGSHLRRQSAVEAFGCLGLSGVPWGLRAHGKHGGYGFLQAFCPHRDTLGSGHSCL